MDERKNRTMERLKHSLQALALPAAAQVLQFPDFTAKTDESVLDFDDWRSCAVENYGDEMSAMQLKSLAAIHAYIGTEDSHSSAWDESAWHSHPFWEELRRLAMKSLAEFGWPAEVPPSYAHEYVRYKEPPIN